jgi:thiamine-monophosphate kinase
VPLVYLAALAFPEAPHPDWMRRFADGLRAAQTAFGCHLIGGDTDRAPGPISIGITAIGKVPRGQMIRRAGARPGDTVFITGTIGDAALGLGVRSDADAVKSWPIDAAARRYLQDRYLRPQPRLGLRRALLAHATAAMDVSDGLAKDFDRLCRASGVAGRMDVTAVPFSAAARQVLAVDATWLARSISAGDDYEILCTVPAAAAAAFATDAAADGMTVTRIGDVAEGAGTMLVGTNGQLLKLARSGWDHF